MTIKFQIIEFYQLRELESRVEKLLRQRSERRSCFASKLAQHEKKISISIGSVIAFSLLLGALTLSLDLFLNNSSKIPKFLFSFIPVDVAAISLFALSLFHIVKIRFRNVGGGGENTFHRMTTICSSLFALGTFGIHLKSIFHSVPYFPWTIAMFPFILSFLIFEYFLVREILGRSYGVRSNYWNFSNPNRLVPRILNFFCRRKPLDLFFAQLGLPFILTTSMSALYLDIAPHVPLTAILSNSTHISPIALCMFPMFLFCMFILGISIPALIHYARARPRRWANFFAMLVCDVWVGALLGAMALVVARVPQWSIGFAAVALATMLGDFAILVFGG